MCFYFALRGLYINLGAPISLKQSLLHSEAVEVGVCPSVRPLVLRRSKTSGQHVSSVHVDVSPVSCSLGVSLLG